MKIAFGAALPVGVGSTCEIFDLQLTRYLAPDKALAALQQEELLGTAPQGSTPAEVRAAEAAGITPEQRLPA